MINPLNELSAVYVQHIAEESPEEQEARITQIVKAIRYRARKSGQTLSKAYNDYIGSVQASSSDRQAVKQKLGLLAGSGNQDDGGLALKQRPEMKEELAVEAKIDDVRDAKLKRAGIDAAARERVKRTMRTARANPDSGKSVLSKQMSSPEQKDRIRRRAHRYTDTLNKDAKDIRRGKTDGPQFQGKTGAERIAQVKREKRMKESFSNWRTDLIEVIDNSYDLKSSKPKTDTKSMEKIGDKKVNNKVVINPPMKEAFEEIGGTIIEMNVDEKFSMAADPSKRESPRPTYKAQDSKKMKLRSKAIKAVGTQRRQDKETGVTEEVLSERPYQITGPHSYTSGDGDPRDDVRIKNTATNVGKPMKNRTRARNKAEKMNREYGASVYRVHKVDEEIDVTKQSSKRKSLGRGSSIKDGAKKTGYESPKEFRDTEKKFAKEEFIAETAVEFFMNEGINEEGLEIFIEELGLEGFVEFIGELAEETFLSEARAAKRRTGGKSYAEVKAEIDAREKAKAEKKAAAKPAPKAAVATAKAKQPTKKPVRDAIARGVFRAVDAYKKGMERHNMAMSTAKKAASVAGKGASEFGKGFASGVKGTVKVAKDVKKAVSEDKRFSNWRDDFQTEASFQIDPKKHREEVRAKKIRTLSQKGATEGERDAAQRKTKGPKLMGEKLNLKTADMGDVIDDFYKSDAPQFKGKSKKKIRQMAIAAKLGAEGDAIDEESRQPKKVRGAKPTEGELHQQRIRKANERILKHGLTSKEKKETQARSKYYSARD
jgi:hypothetical protein